MPTGTAATVGGDVDAALTNQFGDFPSAVASNTDSATRTITSATFANIPTTSVAASLTLTRSTLVAITISVQFGNGSPATPSNSGMLGVALSGALVEAASETYAVSGQTPSQQGTGTAITLWRVVPAGTLTATLQAKYIAASGMTLRNHTVQLAAIRLA